MKIACLQFAPQVGDVDNNLNRADAILHKAKAVDLEGLDLLVLPELAFTGYNFKSLQQISPFLEPPGSGISSLWARTTALKYDCVVVVGYPEKVDVTAQWPASPEYYNSALMVNGDGDTIANYRKSFLYYTDETWALEGREGFFQGDIPGLGNVAMGICMDLNPYQFEAPWEDFEFGFHALDVEANVVILTMAWSTQQDTRLFSRRPQEPDLETLVYWVQRLEPLIHAEIDEEVIVIFCNRTGAEGDAMYVGTSAVLGIKAGEVFVYGVLGRGVKDLLVVDTDSPPISKLTAAAAIGADLEGTHAEEMASDLESDPTEVGDELAPTSPGKLLLEEDEEWHPSVPEDHRYPPVFSPTSPTNTAAEDQYPDVFSPTSPANPPDELYYPPVFSPISPTDPHDDEQYAPVFSPTSPTSPVWPQPPNQTAQIAQAGQTIPTARGPRLLPRLQIPTGPFVGEFRTIDSALMDEDEDDIIIDSPEGSNPPSPVQQAPKQTPKQPPMMEIASSPWRFRKMPSQYPWHQSSGAQSLLFGGKACMTPITPFDVDEPATATSPQARSSYFWRSTKTIPLAPFKEEEKTKNSPNSDSALSSERNPEHCDTHETQNVFNYDGFEDDSCEDDCIDDYEEGSCDEELEDNEEETPQALQAGEWSELVNTLDGLRTSESPEQPPAESPVPYRPGSTKSLNASRNTSHSRVMQLRENEPSERDSSFSRYSINIGASPNLSGMGLNQSIPLNTGPNILAEITNSVGYTAGSPMAGMGRGSLSRPGHARSVSLPFVQQGRTVLRTTSAAGFRSQFDESPRRRPRSLLRHSISASGEIGDALRDNGPSSGPELGSESRDDVVSQAELEGQVDDGNVSTSEPVGKPDYGLVFTSEPDNEHRDDSNSGSGSERELNDKPRSRFELNGIGHSDGSRARDVSRGRQARARGTSVERSTSVGQSRTQASRTRTGLQQKRPPSINIVPGMRRPFYDIATVAPNDSNVVGPEPSPSFSDDNPSPRTIPKSKPRNSQREPQHSPSISDDNPSPTTIPKSNPGSPPPLQWVNYSRIINKPARAKTTGGVGATPHYTSSLPRLSMSALSYAQGGTTNKELLSASSISTSATSPGPLTPHFAFGLSTEPAIFSSEFVFSNSSFAVSPRSPPPPLPTPKFGVEREREREREGMAS